MATSVDPLKACSSDEMPPTIRSPPSSPAGGRWKAPPVCVDASLKQLAMPSAQLADFAFAGDVPTTTTTTLVPVVSEHPPAEVVPVSSSSSTCTRESDNTLSDAEGHHLHGVSLSKTMTPPVLDRDSSGRLNAKVSLRKTSRQGRSSQRWLTDSCTNETVRLTTGCVPILKGGKILLVSSSRKSEWIIPKGGWEQDEPLEESAVRECFEEAGVLGSLGPRLKDIQYETRKAKKRRLEQEEQKQKKLKDEQEGDKSEGEASRRPSLGDASPVSEASVATTPTNNKAFACPSPISSEDLSRIRGQTRERPLRSSDETASVASNVSAAHSQVRLTLFPLYVSAVKDEWPESGRLRTAVDIDEALRMLDKRPEFKAALQEVKDRGLHLVTK